jgi:oxygen-independent coproporphyrinogen III oxidase
MWRSMFVRNYKLLHEKKLPEFPTYSISFTLTMAGVYLHIPFCKQACYYCDFHFSTNHEVKAEMAHALAIEIGLQKDFLNREEIQTIYFGGGTPSLLTEKELYQLLETIHKHHPVSAQTEITLEANPDDLFKKNLALFKKSGITRLSIGIQSFQNDLLKFLNRVHQSTTALTTFYHAREAGFDNISMDLMYAIPGLDDSRWLQDIHQTIELNPEHISCYSLTIEEKTAFGKWLHSGKLKPVDEETAARQLEILMDTLEQAGYEHYEVSNFSKPGFHSRHNSNYWKQEKYLGIGPSAHSYNRNIRQYNINNNHLYLKAIQRGQVPAEVETLTPENKINEYILTTLRTHWGTDFGVLLQQHQYDLHQANRAYIQQLIDAGLATLYQKVLTLTRSGKLLADKIASDLFV